jgi:putative intracellular protease/amidase
MKRLFALVVSIFVLLACGLAAFAQAKKRAKVLVVLSSESELPLKNGLKHRTGFYLNELGVPLKALIDAGFKPVVCNPRGNEAVMDEGSDSPRFFGNDEREYRAIKTFVQALPDLKHPRTTNEIASADLDQFAAVFIPGGHAPMIDLWNDAPLGKILTHFHSRGKPTALICHGPIALLSASHSPDDIISAVKTDKKPVAENWLYKGYKMTVFSDAEEKPNEGPGKLGGDMQFYPEDALTVAGGTVVVAPPKQSHVVHDRELITGQNPYSDREFADALIKVLKTKQQ